jgi:hypothetical protein
VSLKFLRHSP